MNNPTRPVFLVLDLTYYKVNTDGSVNYKRMGDAPDEYSNITFPFKHFVKKAEMSERPSDVFLRWMQAYKLACEPQHPVDVF